MTTKLCCMLALSILRRTPRALTTHSRFLRARRFVPQEAFKQFKDTEDWRKDQNIVDLFETIEVNEYEQTRRLVSFPQFRTCSARSDSCS